MKRTFLTAALGLAAGSLVLAAWRRARALDLRDRVVVITGGSRGLGLALAREFARHGARLALIARSAEELDRAATELRAQGARVETWSCDLRDEAALTVAIHEIATRLGGLDVLVNNAGEIVVGPLDEMEKPDFESAMALHFRAPLVATLEARPYLARHRAGRVVNIASFGGRIAVPHFAPYCASKFALVGLSDVLRAELALAGIRVTTVWPGLMRTGSHVAAKFKGQRRAEFTWFSLGLTVPGLSASAAHAARRIVAATRTGAPDLAITLPARAAWIAQAVAPRTFAGLMKVVAAILPKASGAAPGAAVAGGDVGPRLLPNWAFFIADRAIKPQNQS